jgi:phenylalanyl-tRNA synthetase beta chain
MRVSRRWLEAFLQRPLEVRDLVPRLAMLGAPPDAVEPLAAGLGPVVVGLVTSVAPHPNADRLRVCQVDVGSGPPRQVVTGAPNVAEGRRYPFAGVGVTLPGGLTLERRKLRGEVSEGMLCSARELALGADQDGLLELAVDAAPGTPLPAALGLDDDRLVLDTPAVRGDLLGHKGVARELAASLGVPFRLPPVPGADPAVAVAPPFRRGEGPVTTAAVVEGVRVGPSPEWLARRLEAVGQRPINNVVDVTNYVMFELGQPLHAYDGARLRGGRLESRRARAGERLVTLDGVARVLDPAMTVVADAGGPVGVAGVMGGLDSEVGAATTTVVLEAAWWDPASTRATRRALGLASEAAARFERGTDLWALPEALTRALDVLLAVAGGRVVDAPADVWPEPANPPRVFLRVAEVARIVGVDLPLATIERALTGIGATVLAKPDDGRLAVDVPGWRRDLAAEIDLVEEVARLHGYDRLPDDLRPFRPGVQADPPLEQVAAGIRDGMVAAGLYEVVTLPIGPATGADAVRVANPLSADHGFLRERILPALVRQVEANWASHERDVRLFEVGTTFEAAAGGRPRETTRLAAVVTGARWRPHWTDGGRDIGVDWWDLKGLFGLALSLANPGATMQVGEQALVAVDDAGREVGRAGRLEADRPPWAGPLFGFEVEVDPAPRALAPFTPPPAVPAASRDLAVVVPWAVSAAQVLAVVGKSGGGLLESVEVIDEYRGAGVPDGSRSLAFHLVFRGRDRTLRDKDVDGAVNRIRAALENELGVTLRAT